MAKYIDDDKAIEIVSKWLGQVFGVYSTDNSIGVFRRLRKLPAADVVEVVRCKECKHREYDDFMKDFVCDLDAADPYDRSRCAEDDEWFCKDGERTR